MLELLSMYNLSKKKENFHGRNEERIIKQQINAVAVIFFLIGFVNAYLSWTCNSAQGLTTGLKVIYAIGAFMSGIFYLIFYGVFRAGTCKAGMCS